MTARGRRYLIKPLAFGLAAIMLSGCVTPWADSSGRYTEPVGGAPVIANETPYSNSLRCLDSYTAQKPLRVAVGQIADYTGKYSSDSTGHAVTQGAALMAMSALAKAGVPLVERFDTSVAELELKYANNKLITDDPAAGGQGDYRKIFAGSIPGSNYYLVGGITELNFNIRSMGASGDGGTATSKGLKGTASANIYVMNIGLDLRLVDTDTLEVVDVVSYQKQIVGHQIQAGVFDFLGATFFDASLGESGLEPIQLAVRSVIERATLEMMTRLYKIPAGTCAGSLNTADDPLADTGNHEPYAPPARVSTAAATTTRENSYDSTRQDPYYGYSTDNPSPQPGLRGGVD